MQSITPVTSTDLLAASQACLFKFEVYDGSSWINLCSLGGKNYLKSISCSMAGAGVGTEPVAGSWSVTLDNEDGIFHPYHPSSTYHDLLQTGRKARLSWGATYSSTPYYWQRTIGYMDAPRFDLRARTVTISGTDYAKVLADTALAAPYLNWGTTSTFSSIATGGTGTELYAEADALEVGSGEANNVSQWTVGATGGTVSTASPGQVSNYYLTFTRDAPGTTSQYVHNSNAAQVEAGKTYLVTFWGKISAGSNYASVRFYQTVSGVAQLITSQDIAVNENRWVYYSVQVPVTATGNFQIRLDTQGKYAGASDVVHLDQISIKKYDPETWMRYDLPSTCNGVYFVTLDQGDGAQPVWHGDEDGMGGWHYDTTTKSLYFSEDMAILAGTNNLIIYYYTSTAPEDVVADLLVAGHLYNDRATAKAAMSYTATGITIPRVWFETGTSALEAMRLICERCNYRFWFGYSGTPTFKPAPSAGSAVLTLSSVGHAFSMELYQDLSQVINKVTIEGAERSLEPMTKDKGGAAKWSGSLSDSASITAYQEKAMAITNHLFQDQDSIDAMLTTLIGYNHEPKFYVDLTLAYLPAPLEIGDTIQVAMPYSTTGSVNKTLIIRDINLSNGQGVYTCEVYVPIDIPLYVQDAGSDTIASNVNLTLPGQLSIQNATSSSAADNVAIQQTFDYTTAQSGTSLSVPTGATQAVIECWGTGGNGGDGNQEGRAGGGGGGAYSKKTISVSGGDTLLIYLPAAPASTDTYVTKGGVTQCLAKRGEAGSTTGYGAGGAAASGTGDTKWSGGNGYFYATGYVGGGGGSSAGTAANGNAATSSTGASAVTDGGPGGNGGARYVGGSAPASGPGGGGGGAGEDLATPRYGGAGYIGRVRIVIS